MYQQQMMMMHQQQMMRQQMMYQQGMAFQHQAALRARMEADALRAANELEEDRYDRQRREELRRMAVELDKQENARLQEVYNDLASSFDNTHSITAKACGVCQRLFFTWTWPDNTGPLNAATGLAAYLRGGWDGLIPDGQSDWVAEVSHYNNCCRLSQHDVLLVEQDFFSSPKTAVSWMEAIARTWVSACTYETWHLDETFAMGVQVIASLLRGLGTVSQSTALKQAMQVQLGMQWLAYTMGKDVTTEDARQRCVVIMKRLVDGTGMSLPSWAALGITPQRQKEAVCRAACAWLQASPSTSKSAHERVQVLCSHIGAINLWAIQYFVLAMQGSPPRAGDSRELLQEMVAALACVAVGHRWAEATALDRMTVRLGSLMSTPQNSISLYLDFSAWQIEVELNGATTILDNADAFLLKDAVIPKSRSKNILSEGRWFRELDQATQDNILAKSGWRRSQLQQSCVLLLGNFPHVCGERGGCLGFRSKVHLRTTGWGLIIQPRRTWTPENCNMRWEDAGRMTVIS